MDAHITKIRLPIYCTPLWIVVHPSLSKSIDLIEDKHDVAVLTEDDKRSTRAMAFAYEDHGGTKRFFLFLKPTSRPGEIAHEVKHLLNLIFGWHEVRLSLKNDEHECYYLEFLIDKVHGAIKKTKKKA